MSQPRRIKRPYIWPHPRPENTVNVARPTRYGNPFKVGVDATDNTEAVEMYRRYLDSRPDLVAEIRQKLRGQDLACFCNLDQPCHADVLLTIANPTNPKGQP